MVVTHTVQQEKKKGTNNEFKLLVFVSKRVYTNILDQFLNT